MRLHASAPRPDRVLTNCRAVIGGVHGNFKAVFTKFETLHAKNGIALAIIVGDLFANVESEESQAERALLLNGQIEVPIPTYFALGSHAFPDDAVLRLRENNDELCPNLHFLGRRAALQTSEGIKIVALGGKFQNTDASSERIISEYTPSYSSEDVRILQTSGVDADILVTNEWPAGLRRGSHIDFADTDVPSSEEAISQLCDAIKPRYHFSHSDAFFEREPFAHTIANADAVPRITRFISIAPQGTTTKQKWVYGFSLDPKASQPDAVGIGATASPFLGAANMQIKRKANEEPQNGEGGFSRFATGVQQGGRHERQSHGRRGKRQRLPPPTPQECFFCLSNPNIASHIIASIGDSAYLTTAKGPLSTSQTYSDLGFPGHILIIPFEHSATLSAIADTDARTATYKEMIKYQKALQDMLVQRIRTESGGDPTLGAITWEVNKANGIHLHWQFMPIPLDLISRGLVEAAFKVQAENEKYPTPSTRTISIDDDDELPEEPESDYFRARIWAGNNSKVKELTLSFDQDIRFNPQFGRQVVGKLLGLDDRLDWRDCGQTETEETADVEAFKLAFKEHDFANA